ncbi:MAG: hypothetical protein ACRCS6_07820 [Turicibacter sp.]
MRKKLMLTALVPFCCYVGMLWCTLLNQGTDLNWWFSGLSLLLLLTAGLLIGSRYSIGYGMLILYGIMIYAIGISDSTVDYVQQLVGGSLILYTILLLTYEEFQNKKEKS